MRRGSPLKHPLAELERGVGLRKQRVNGVAAHLEVHQSRAETTEASGDNNLQTAESLKRHKEQLK